MRGAGRGGRGGGKWNKRGKVRELGPPSGSANDEAVRGGKLRGQIRGSASSGAGLAPTSPLSSVWGPPQAVAPAPPAVDLDCVDTSLVDADLPSARLEAAARVTDVKLGDFARNEMLEWLERNGSASLLRSVHPQWRKAAVSTRGVSGAGGPGGGGTPKSFSLTLKQLTGHALRLRDSARGLLQRRQAEAEKAAAAAAVAAEVAAQAAADFAADANGVAEGEDVEGHEEEGGGDGRGGEEEEKGEEEPQVDKPHSTATAALAVGETETARANQCVEAHSTPALVPAAEPLATDPVLGPPSSSAPALASAPTAEVAGSFLLPPALVGIARTGTGTTPKALETFYAGTSAQFAVSRALRVPCSLEALLAAYTAPEQLLVAAGDGYRCPRCCTEAHAEAAARADALAKVQAGAQPEAQVPPAAANAEAEAALAGTEGGASAEATTAAPAPASAPVPPVAVPHLLRDATKRLLLLADRAPLILTLHVKRFKQVQVGAQGKAGRERDRGPRARGLSGSAGTSTLVKVSAYVDLPELLHLAPFAATTVGAAASEPPPLQYRLLGLVVHSGGMTGGHYIAFVRSGGEWSLCNDGSVSSSSLEDALRSEAYVCLFERQ